MSARLPRSHFEDLYREDADPWGFATSAYERAKYDHTLAALGERRFARGFEPGCSIGILSEALAGRCGHLLCVDVADGAVVAARARLAGLSHVEVERRDLPEDLPSGPFDLVVCSEILYYWSRELLEAAVPRLDALVAPGGSLIAVHWRPPTGTYPLRGDEVHDLLLERSALVHALDERRPRYRLDRLDRPA